MASYMDIIELFNKPTEWLLISLFNDG